MQKISYHRTTLELCDAFTAVVRQGLKLGFFLKYPDFECYNGRRWVDEFGGECALYYIKSQFRVCPSVGLAELSLRMVIIRRSDKTVAQGLPQFWCTVWYREGKLGNLSSEPATYTKETNLSHLVVTREELPGVDCVREFDVSTHSFGLNMLQQPLPPLPIQFG